MLIESVHVYIQTNDLFFHEGPHPKYPELKWLMPYLAIYANINLNLNSI